jgi:hypothetical protein
MYKPWDSMLRALCSVANPEVSSDDQIGRALQEAEVLVQVSLQLPEGLNLAPWLVRAEASSTRWCIQTWPIPRQHQEARSKRHARSSGHWSSTRIAAMRMFILA